MVTPAGGWGVLRVPALPLYLPLYPGRGAPSRENPARAGPAGNCRNCRLSCALALAGCVRRTANVAGGRHRGGRAPVASREPDSCAYRPCSSEAPVADTAPETLLALLAVKLLGGRDVPQKADALKALKKYVPDAVRQGWLAEGEARPLNKRGKPG